MQKVNKSVRVGFSGGLLGALFGNKKGKIDGILQRENADGWNLAYVIPDNRNLAIIILQLIVLVATLFLWTFSTGHLFIFEKPR